MNNIHKEALLEKIANRQIKIGVVGLGYVGLPLCLRFSEVFTNVIGFDIDPEKTNRLENGESYIKQISHERVQKAIQSGLKPTTDYSLANDCDFIALCLPTPLTKHQEPDLSYVRVTIESLMPYLKAGQALSLESTTFPGTTEELIVPRVQQRGFVCGEDYFVIYSPEREDPGNKNFSTHQIPRVVGGYTEHCKDVGVALYASIIEKIVPVSSTKAAEMTKLLENIYRAVNIGLVNEMKIVADKMGINIHEVINAAATKPFGFTKFQPGMGVGGHCIPIDPFYLTWKAKEFGINTRFIELSGEVNRHMPEWIVGKLVDALNNHGKSLKGAKILVLGIAYKKNVDDPRESPSVKIMELLRSKGASVEYSDPLIPKFPKMRGHTFDLSSTDAAKENIRSYDAVVLATDHDEFNYKDIVENSSLLIDTTGRFKGDNVVPC